MPRASKYAEIADREAEPDAAEPTDAEPAAEPDAEPAVTLSNEHAGEIIEPADGEPVDMEKALRDFERENRRHEQALRKIMGDDFDAFEPCHGCDGIGYRPAGAMQPDPDTEQCPRCKGHGNMLSGSVNEMTVLRACTQCAGQGFVVKVDHPPEPSAPAQRVPLFDPFTGAPLEPGSQPAVNFDLTPWAPGYVPPGAPAAGTG